jgi:outer membrane protein assembly factor BamB
MRFALLLAIPLLASAADNWPGWRGPAGNGVSTLTSLPISWSTERNLAWKIAVEGRGHSSPVVWGNRLFLTTDIEGEVIPGAEPPKHTVGGQPYLHPDATSGNRKHTLKVLCFEVATGKLLWERTVHDGRVFDDRHRFNTYATPTTVTDGKFVYAYFDSQGLYKFDVDGKLIWKMSLGPILTKGLGSGVSPILFEGKILILADQDGGDESFLVAISQSDGKIVWKTPRKERQTWMTPLIVDAGGKPVLIVTGAESVVAYDPRTGVELWRTEGLDGNAVHSPVVGEGMVFVTSGYPKKKVMALRLNPKEGEDRIAWKYERGTGYTISPILYGDYLYLLSDAGILTCLVAKTGEVKYDSKRFSKPGRFGGAPVAFDGKLLMTSQDGDSYVVKAGPVYEVLAANSLEEAVVASPALAGDSVYIRTAGHLYRIRELKK